ncbi:MAG: PQQ-binding-like beta-propeller repeat protein [Gemmataceae bacterium]
MKLRLLLALAVTTCFTPQGWAADWPQWLGLKRDGATAETVAPWKGDLKVVWKAEVGNGFSMPIVANGRVYLHTRSKDASKEEEEVVAYSLEDGKVLWSDSYARPAYKSVLGTGPRATPTVAGKRLFTMGINGVLTVYDADTGKRRWQKDLYKEFKADLPNFAVCGSPLVVGNRVIVSVGGKGRCVIGLDVESGDVAWQALDDAASTSSPVLFRSKGTLPDVVFMTPLRLVGLNPIDGTLRWEHAMAFQTAGTSPTPCIVGNHVVASTQAHGAVAVSVKETNGDHLETREEWQNKGAKSYFSSGVAAGKNLFLVTNAVEPIPNAFITAVEAESGKKLWSKSVGYFHVGLIKTGDGKLLALNDSGRLFLYEADASGAKELARAKVCNGTLVNPALAQGRLLVRDDKELICLELPPAR